MIIEKFVLSKTAPRNKYVGWIDTSGDEPKIKFNVGGKWSEEYDPEQVQVDWNCVDTTSKAFIKNKPTIPAAQIQSDWNQSDSSAVDYIKNKPTISVEPLIVNGTVVADGNDAIFTPDASETTTLDEAYEAMIAGTPVMARFYSESLNMTITVSLTVSSTAIEDGELVVNSLRSDFLGGLYWERERQSSPSL